VQRVNTRAVTATSYCMRFSAVGSTPKKTFLPLTTWYHTCEPPAGALGQEDAAAAVAASAGPHRRAAKVDVVVGVRAAHGENAVELDLSAAGWCTSEAHEGRHLGEQRAGPLLVRLHRCAQGLWPHSINPVCGRWDNEARRTGSSALGQKHGASPTCRTKDGVVTLRSILEPVTSRLITFSTGKSAQ
jgi:hypothetical protein